MRANWSQSIAALRSRSYSSSRNIISHTADSCSKNNFAVKTFARGAVVDVDIEDSFEQSGPTHARRRVIACGRGCLLWWTGDDFTTQLCVRREHAMEIHRRPVPIALLMTHPLTKSVLCTPTLTVSYLCSFDADSRVPDHLLHPRQLGFHGRGELLGGTADGLHAEVEDFLPRSRGVEIAHYLA